MNDLKISVSVSLRDGVLFCDVGGAVSSDPCYSSLSFDVLKVPPKTVHAVILSSVSDVLACGFNELLSEKK